MAHVQIPAKEDIAQFPFHHAGVQALSELPSISLTGEGCEIEQLDAYAFKIKVSQQAEKSLEAITDFGPLWDALHDLEERVKFGHGSADINHQQAIRRDSLIEERLERIAGHCSLIEARQNILTANLSAARDFGRYALCGAALSTALSLGMWVWILSR